MINRSSLLALAVIATVSVASGDNKPAAPKPAPAAAAPAAATHMTLGGDYDFSGKALLANPALLKEIDDTLITGAGCRTMATLGYGNGYQCPATGLAACMTMLKAGKVDACAALTGRDYGCIKETTPQQRANSECSDLSADLWKTLAIKVPYDYVKKRLEAYGCKAETGTTIFCKSHIREWLCQPFERGGVVVCRPPKIVKVCTGGDVNPYCYGEET